MKPSEFSLDPALARLRAGSLTREEVRAGNYAGAHFTPEQGRVLFQMERIFRSTGGGIKAHAEFLKLCDTEGLPVRVDTWSLGQCVRGLQLIERAARISGLHFFRAVDTGWQGLALKLAEQQRHAGAFIEAAHS
jgi:hypothetical protein